MPAITWVFVVAAAVAVFVIAAVVVGREAHRLDAVAPRSVYIPEEALEFVAEYLPAESQARLRPDELEQLLTMHMRWLHAKGLQPTNVIDRRQDISTPVVVSEDDVVAYLLGQADQAADRDHRRRRHRQRRRCPPGLLRGHRRRGTARRRPRRRRLRLRPTAAPGAAAIRRSADQLIS
ncbi:MAG: hypothetical protein V9E89_10545 [Ilumatobacteraceae bacterium]